MIKPFCNSLYNLLYTPIRLLIIFLLLNSIVGFGQSNVVLTNEQIEDLNDCEVLDGNLFIHGGLELTDINLLPLSNLRIINGYLVISKRGSINLRRIVNS